MGEDKCEAGCQHFHGGDIRHHKDCVYYPESLAKIIDDLKSKLHKAKSALEFYADHENHDRDGTFEHKVINDKNEMTDYWVDYGYTAREALEEIEGLG